MFCKITTIIPFQRELKKCLLGIVLIQIFPFCIKYRLGCSTYFRYKQNVDICVYVCLIKG